MSTILLWSFFVVAVQCKSNRRTFERTGCVWTTTFSPCRPKTVNVSSIEVETQRRLEKIVDVIRSFPLDFDQINVEISRAEKKLKEKIKKLYDAEKQPEIRGYNLKSLSREERQEFDQLLEPYIWSEYIYADVKRKKNTSVRVGKRNVSLQKFD